MYSISKHSENEENLCFLNHGELMDSFTILKGNDIIHYEYARLKDYFFTKDQKYLIVRKWSSSIYFPTVEQYENISEENNFFVYNLEDMKITKTNIIASKYCVDKKEEEVIYYLGDGGIYGVSYPSMEEVFRRECKNKDIKINSIKFLENTLFCTAAKYIVIFHKEKAIAYNFSYDSDEISYIKKIGEYYFIGTYDGNIIVFDENFNIVFQKQKVSREYITKKGEHISKEIKHIRVDGNFLHINNFFKIGWKNFP